MPALKGIMLAIVNVLVIAIGMSVVEHKGEVFMLVVMFGGIPALVLGSLLGLFAGLTATRSRHWRTVLLSLPAFGLVVLLAAFFRLDAAVPIACVPTFIAALVLERWTRQIVPAPVPVATVRSTRT
jgi:ABC-type dipeptide/oligopeptide/nickel transport system permease subunit